jgi:hypothetical protein
MYFCIIFLSYFLNTSRVPATLLPGNSTNAYISYQYFLPESLPYYYCYYNIIPKPNIFTDQYIVITVFDTLD